MSGRPDLPTSLLDPRAYSHPVGEVELITTHLSWIALAGDFAYKVKRPVDVGFVDFRDPARRLRACQDEVRLNRPLAGDMYIGVTPLVARDDGSLSVGGDGPPLEHAVHMWRLSAAAMLDAKLERGEVDNSDLETLVTTLARFHREAKTGESIDEHGRPDVFLELALDNLRALADHVCEDLDAPVDGTDPAVLSKALLAFLFTTTRKALDRARTYLEDRVRRGCIRDGHGDLHAGNICFRETGMVIYDRIEFSDAFRCCDVANDVAFLAMDLDYRGYRGFSGRLVDRYAAVSGDDGLKDILPLYKTYRALVRAKVAAIRSADATAHPSVIEEARADARRHVHLAASYALPPALVLLTGLPASGKSFLATGLARPFEATVITSDRIRKRLLGLPPDHHAPAAVGQGIYDAATTSRTYDAVLARALEALEGGRSAVVDATFPDPARRAPFLALAEALSCPVFVVEVTVPDSVTRDRLAARARHNDGPSDADLTVYEAARRSYLPPDEVPPSHRISVDGRTSREAAAARLLDAMIATR